MDARQKKRACKREEKPMKRTVAVKLLCKEQMILLAAVALFGSGFAGTVAYYEFIEQMYGLYVVVAELLVMFAIVMASGMFFGCVFRIDALINANAKKVKENDIGVQRSYIKRFWNRLFGNAGLYGSVGVLDHIPQRPVLQKRNKSRIL
jgi:hypothetical protein